jgi:hypothetical protein
MTTVAKGRDDARAGTRSCCVLGSHLGRQRQLRHQYRGQISNLSPVSHRHLVSHGQALPSFFFSSICTTGKGLTNSPPPVKAMPGQTLHAKKEKHQPLPCRGNWKPGLAMIRKKRQARYLWDRNKVGNRAAALCDLVNYQH